MTGSAAGVETGRGAAVESGNAAAAETNGEVAAESGAAAERGGDATETTTNSELLLPVHTGSERPALSSARLRPSAADTWREDTFQSWSLLAPQRQSKGSGESQEPPVRVFISALPVGSSQ